MEKFIVSARKYRPNNFLTLVGQESIATTLKNSIRRDQLAHAYLFCGPRGVGKTSTARIFAKTINCTNPGADLEPCGECESCVSFAQGRSYCIHELDAASNNSVDDIRLLTEKVMIPPQIGKYSVYIIDEVHMLSSAAFNAFLKTLEEPPAHAIFILATTEKHKILPTILSRCQTYDFNRISVEDIVKNLASIAKKEGISIDSDALHVIATKADGAMRDALTLFDQSVAFCGTTIDYGSIIKNLNVLDYEYYFNIIESSLNGSFSKSLLLFDEILTKGFNALYFVSGLSNHLRNLLVCKDTSTLKLLEMAPAVAQRYQAQSGRCTFRFLYEALACTTRCESEYKASSNQRLTVEFLLVKLSQLTQEHQNVQALATAQQSAAAAPAPVAAQQPLAQPVKDTAPQTPPAAPESTQQTAAQSSDAAQSTAQQASAAPQAPAAPQSGWQPAPLDAVQQAHTGSTQPAREDEGQSSFKPKMQGGGISIKDFIKKAQNTPKEQTQTTVTEEIPVSRENLESAWSALADNFTKTPRLAQVIKNARPQYDEQSHTIIFEVGNSATQMWIEKNALPKIIGLMQASLKNGNINVSVRTAEVKESAEDKLYMPVQKAKFLMQNYPELAALGKDMELDVK